MSSDESSPEHRTTLVRRRDYPGWHMVWALAGTTTVAYGVLYYAFAVFLLPMQHDLGFSRTAVTGAFSLSMILTGVAAIPIGAWLDHHGARVLMTLGSLLGGGCVLAWSEIHSLAGLYAVFAGIGVAGAAVQYEPAFATVNAYFEKQRRNALLTITVVAGFASTIFLPASALLINLLGWRHALWVLALVQAATAIPHAVLLRRRPADHGWARDGIRAINASPAVAGSTRTLDDSPASKADRSSGLKAALRARSVVLLTLAAVLGSAAIGAVSVHLVTYLREHAYPVTVAGAATGALGAVQVAGRIILTASARRFRLAVVTAIMLGGQALAVVALLVIGGPVGLAGFVLLFGAGFGVLHIARADLLADYVPRRLYARISGIQALLVIAGEGLAPTGAAALRTASGSYTSVFLLVGACALAAALLFLAADQAHRHVERLVEATRSATASVDALR